MKYLTAFIALLFLTVLPASAAETTSSADFVRQAIGFQAQFGNDANAVYSAKANTLPLSVNLFGIPGMPKAAASTVWQGAMLSSKAVVVNVRGQGSDIVFYNPMTDVAFVTRWVRETAGIHLTVFLATTGNRIRGESLLKYDGKPYWDYTVHHAKNDEEIDFALQARQTAAALLGYAQPEAMDGLIATIIKDAPEDFTKGKTTHTRVAFARSYASIIGLAEKVNKDSEGLRRTTGGVTACLRNVQQCDDKLAGGVNVTGVSDERVLAAVMEKLDRPSEYYVFKAADGSSTELYIFVNPLMPNIVVQGWLEQGKLSKVAAYDYDTIMDEAAQRVGK